MVLGCTTCCLEIFLDLFNLLLGILFDLGLFGYVLGLQIFYLGNVLIDLGVEVLYKVLLVFLGESSLVGQLLLQRCDLLGKLGLHSEELVIFLLLARFTVLLEIIAQAFSQFVESSNLCC